MFGVTTSDDYQPITWVGRHPVDMTTLLVALHVILTVLTCFLAALPSGAGFLSLLIFDSQQVLTLGRVWQLITYAFVHAPYSSALLWFAIEMWMFFFFGRTVERFIGRRDFIGLYTFLLFVPTGVLTIAGLWTRLGVAGSTTLHFGIFIAFAAIYPSVELLFRIEAKWIAIILAVIGTLAALATHDWAEIITLWTTIATAVFFLRFRGIGPELVWWSNLKTRLQPKPKFHVVPPATSGRGVEPQNVHDSIDPVLEKISKHGIKSLTPSERRQLDRARTRLLNKSR